MDPMLGREVIERQQRVELGGDLGRRLGGGARRLRGHVVGAPVFVWGVCVLERIKGTGTLIPLDAHR